MKDTSKARWGVDAENCSEDDLITINKYRDLQIDALPQMVALLKRGALETEKITYLDGSSWNEPTAFTLDCEALLKQIGEIE